MWQDRRPAGHALRVGAVLFEGSEHIAELRDQLLTLLDVLQLVLAQALRRCRVEIAHGADEDVGDVVDGLLELLLDQVNRQGVALGRLEVLHLANVECPGLEDEQGFLRHGNIHDRRQSGSERAQAAYSGAT